MRRNPLRERFASGYVALGGWISIPGSITAEAMAATDLDYLCIDMQHGLVDYSDSVQILQALTLGTATPAVRVPENTPSHISKALDTGAMAIIIPMVNSTAECEAAVESCYYSPKGGRSFGPTRALWVEGSDYCERANDTISCIPMVETVAAVEAIDGIISVPGVEAIYVGPADLAISMGLAPGQAQPEFLEMLATIVEACTRHGVVPGIHATPRQVLSPTVQNGGSA
jgi:4-hydroxy-2-oxoheptanedioate aldolase